jgi:iron(III) transport system ATP-binding protein
MSALLEIDRVSKRFRDTDVIRDVSFSLHEGEIGCLLGPSGCGKTTLLRIIAGFDDPTSGAVRIGGEVVGGEGRFVPPERRRIGMVFQDYALFPHLSVLDNVVFGLDGLARAARRDRGRRLLDAVGLADAAGKHPHQLSGGQQQRVALARALAPEPRLLLMDEPFSNLDVSLRERLSAQVRSLLKDRGMTALMVSHNQHEAFAMADEVGVLFEGRMQQWSQPHVLYHEPVNVAVAGFVGEGVLIPGRIVRDGAITCGLGELRGDTSGFTQGESVRILVRPEDILHDDAGPLSARVIEASFRGASMLYRLRLDSGDVVLALAPSHHRHPVGDRIGVRYEVDHVVAFPDGSGQGVGDACATEYGPKACANLG